MVVLNTIGFKDWMRNNTSLKESSIVLYGRTIAAFTDQYNELTIENLNKFISQSVRGKNSYYMKYAFKSYFAFLGKTELYDKLVQVKVPPRKKLGTRLGDDDLDCVVAAIRIEKYKDVAHIQSVSAARARGVLLIHEANIDFNFHPDVIRIRLHEKGGKEGMIYLLRSLFEPILKKYTGKGFLFLPEHSKHADDKDLQRIVSNEYTYYWTAVTDAAKALGFDKFSTHDFRRSVSQIWKKSGVQLRTIAKGLSQAGDLRITDKYFGDEDDEIQGAMLSRQVRK